MGGVKDVSQSETQTIRHTDRQAIKQEDRLSGRQAIHEELWISYLSLIRLSWSLGSPGSYHLLRACLPHSGTNTRPIKVGSDFKIFP